MTQPATPDDGLNYEALARAKSALARLEQIRSSIPAETDIDAMHRALNKATDALTPASITAAIRDESSFHITARLDLVIAHLHDLEAATSLLAELAEKLRADCRDIQNAVEMPSDGDL